MKIGNVAETTDGVRRTVVELLSDTEVKCFWFEGYELKRGVFAISDLVLV